MDRWLNLKRKSVDSDDEGASSSKQCEPTRLLRKCRRYSKEYLSMGFTCSGPEDKQLPQCVLCYDVLSNEAMKPSKLRRHLETKHKEHITKSIDFFRSKEQELRESKKIVKRSTSGCNNENAVRASFEVSHLISKTGKPHTIAEELVLPAAKIMVSALISEKAAKDLSLIPLSNDTVKKRIVSLSENIKEQLLERVRMFPYFALQLDESTDITNKATLMCYVRYEHLKSVYEDLLFISYLTHTTAEEVFASLNAFIISHNMDWLRCVGVSTDGARAMSGRLTGLAARIKEIAPSATWFHCCLHRDALVVKKIPEELQQTLNESVKIVNFIKNKSLNSRLFEQLCKEMDSEYHQLLLHCEVRWLSRGKVLSRLWELRDEIRLFLLDKQFHLSDRLNDFSWLVKLAYLSDIFIHLNNLNISLQGEKVTVFLVEDKIEAMIKKLELWRQRILNGKYEETFPNFSNFFRFTEEEL